jgi:two-component system sensor histidine kinase/response regulator
LLRKFAESANVEEIRVALAAGDSATAARAAHSLKGAAANLGANTVANTAAEVEAAIKAGQTVESLLDTLAKKLRAVVQAIESALPNAEAPVNTAAAPADPASVTAPLRKLAKLLANDDGDAADFILEAQPDLAKVLTATEITALRDFVSNYDFVGALKCVADIAGRLGLKLE